MFFSKDSNSLPKQESNRNIKFQQAQLNLYSSLLELFEKENLSKHFRSNCKNTLPFGTSEKTAG